MHVCDIWHTLHACVTAYMWFESIPDHRMRRKERGGREEERKEKEEREEKSSGSYIYMSL